MYMNGENKLRTALSVLYKNVYRKLLFVTVFCHSHL